MPIYSVNGLANDFAATKVPLPAVGQADPPANIQLRANYAFKFKVTMFVCATALAIGCIALAILPLISTIFGGVKLLLAVSALALLARRAFIKDLTIDGIEPNNDDYKNILRRRFGFAEDNPQWVNYRPVEWALLGYHLLLNPAPLPVVAADQGGV